MAWMGAGPGRMPTSLTELREGLAIYYWLAGWNWEIPCLTATPPPRELTGSSLTWNSGNGGEPNHVKITGNTGGEVTLV